MPKDQHKDPPLCRRHLRGPEGVHELESFINDTVTRSSQFSQPAKLASSISTDKFMKEFLW